MSVVIYVFLASIVLGIILIGFDIYKYIKTKDYNWKKLLSSTILILSFLMVILVSRDLFLLLENTKESSKYMTENYKYGLKMKEKYKYCTKEESNLIPLTGNKYDDIVYENINLAKKISASQSLCDKNQDLSNYLIESEMNKLKNSWDEIKNNNDKNRKKLLFL